MHTTINKILFILFFLNAALLARDINIDSIVKDSIKSNKHVFVFLHRTDCGYCESMLSFTLDDDAVKELIKNDFTYVHININDDDFVTYKEFKGSGHDFAKHIGYNFYPSSIFIDNKNEIIYAIPGYQEEDKFLKILYYINSGAYKTVKYKNYKYNR